MMIYSRSTYENYPLYQGEDNPPRAYFTSVTQGLSPLFLAAKRVALACGVALVCCGIVAMSLAAPATSLFWIASASLAFGIALSIVGLLMMRHQSRVKQASRALHDLTLGNASSFARYKKLLDMDRCASYEFMVPSYVQRIKKKYKSEELSESTWKDCVRGWDYFVDDQPVKNDLIDSSYEVYLEYSRFVEENKKMGLNEDQVELVFETVEKVINQSDIERFTGEIETEFTRLKVEKEKFETYKSRPLLNQIEQRTKNLLLLRQNLMNALVREKYTKDVSLFASQQSLELVCAVLGRRYNNTDNIGCFRFNQWSSSPITVVGEGEIAANFKEGRYLLLQQNMKIEWGFLGEKTPQKILAATLTIDFKTGDATVIWKSPKTRVED